MTMQSINALEIPENAVLIDIRDDLERSAKPIISSFQVLEIALVELEDRNPNLPNNPLVVVCTTGRQSEYAGALLEALGASKVLILQGGMKGLG
jgi:rhodanese-related sulfurtransferase